ncbi:MAG: family 43 glycosylhydrolase [Rikenellaceae bacterium]|jgi:beta-xylosidase|nr:family 43 glycosylhydrolase [Rikenellaceae bacterium]
MKRIFALVCLGLLAAACCQNQKETKPATLDPNLQGDLGNGTYINPVLGGDYADPTIMRDGEDYYMTHSCFNYLPGLVVFHSKDLVNWEPISYGLTTYLGSGYAPDICKYEDKYYIYFTVSGVSNFVVWADSPYGPWSKPIDLKVGNIDPCHVVGEDGSRWMFLSRGTRVRLTDDGLAIVPGTLETVYEGWQYPADWVTECFCLESPKLRYIDGYYYYINAEGGTAGPPTSHMATLARSKSINGPWENDPNNPLVHTWDAKEHWWSKGHASMIDTPEGEWWLIYHAYENGFYNLGRQTLLEPLEGTGDGWFRIPEGIQADQPIKKPIASTPGPDRRTRLGEFRIGLDWKFYRDFDTTRYTVNNNTLTLKAQGDRPGNSSPIMCVAGNHAYEISCEIEKSPGSRAGIVLYYDSTYYGGIGFDSENRFRYRRDAGSGRYKHTGGDHLWLKIRNDNQVVTGYYSYDGQTWEKEDWALEVSGFNHNTLHQFQSVLPALFVTGEGQATFKNLKYTVL